MKINNILKNTVKPFIHFKEHIKKPLYQNLKHKSFFIILNLIVSFHINYIFYLSDSLLFTSKEMDVTVILTAIILFIITYNFIIFLCYKFQNKSLSIYENKKKLNKKTILIYAFPCLVILTLSLLANFPGLISPDTFGQLREVEAFSFNDWHPVIHTFIIWLITRIVDHYAFFIFVQAALFSIGVGYIIATLEAWGFKRKILIITYCFIILNPYTINIMMYAWKDCFLTVLLLYAITMIIDIYLTDAKSLLKIKNIVFFSILMALASIIRHNGIFFTIPVLFLLAVLYYKNGWKIFLTILSCLLIIFLIKGPLYSALKVTYPDNKFAESAGVPMTILGDILIKKPDALSEETKDMLYKFATEEQWHTRYAPGDFNSIKFGTNFKQEINNIPVKDFFSMLFDAIGSARREAFIAFRDATEIGWNISDQNSMIYYPQPYNQIENPIRKWLNIGFTNYTVLMINFPIISSLIIKAGCCILALLIVGIIAFCRRGFKVFILILPSVAYTLGTMLLLCTSWDIRFFHFNVVITLPILLTLLAKKNINFKDQPEKNEIPEKIIV